MDLSIIILNYKTKNLVRMCVKGILASRPQCSYEIIVVDNASGDGILSEVEREFPDVRRIPSSKNIGFGPGNNLGIRASRGRYAVIMNPDIVIMDDSLDRMVRFMDAHQEIGILGPKLKNPDGSLQYSCYRFPEPMIPVYRRTPLGRFRAGQAAMRRYLMEDWDHKSVREVDWVLGACLMMRRETVEKIGAFDERYFLYFEDTDLCRRAWLAGWKVVYNPEIEIVHYHRRESAGSFVKLFTNWITREHLKSGIKYFWKYRGQPAPRLGFDKGVKAKS